MHLSKGVLLGFLLLGLWAQPVSAAVPNPPQASVAPHNLYFGVGDGSAKIVTVTNTSTITPLVLSTPAFSWAPGGAPSGEFQATSSDCTNGLSLAALGTCSISVTFTPAQPSVHTLEVATLQVNDNAANTPQTVTVEGNVPLDKSVLNPSVVNFPNQVVGTSATSIGLALSNQGLNSITLGIKAFILQSPNPPVITPPASPLPTPSPTTTAPFGLGNDGCSNLVLHTGDSCVVIITFAPTSPGDFSGTVTVVSSTPGSPQTVAVLGKGVDALVKISPATLSFSAVVGTTALTQTITVTNNGSAALNTLAPSVTGTAFGASACSPVAVPAGGQCTITVGFTTGTQGGVVNSVLTVNSDAAGTAPTVSLQGTTSQAGIQVNPPVFPAVTVGQSNTQPFYIVANGGATLHVTVITLGGADSASFKVNHCSALPIVLNVGGQCIENIVFSPTSEGTKTATLTLTDDAPASPQTYNLTAIASLPIPSPSPSPLPSGAPTPSSNCNPLCPPIPTTPTPPSGCGAFCPGGGGGGPVPSPTITYPSPVPSAVPHSPVPCTSPSPSAEPGSSPSPSPSSGPVGSPCPMPSVSPSPSPTLNSPSPLPSPSASCVPTNPNASSTPSTSPSPSSPGSPTATCPPTATTSLTFDGPGKKTAIFTNGGYQPIDIYSTAVTGANAIDFKISNDHCISQSLLAGASCALDVTFAPTGTQGTKRGQVALQDSQNKPTMTVALEGTFISSPPPAASSGGGMPWWIWPLVALGLAGVGGGAYYVLRMQRRKTQLQGKMGGQRDGRRE